MIILGKGTVITRDADRPIIMMVLLLSTGLKLLILVHMMSYVKLMQMQKSLTLMAA